MFSGVGLIRARTIKNQTFYLNEFIKNIENKDDDIFPKEYQGLEKACEIFDMILYGAGCFKKKYMHSNAISMDDYHSLFELARVNGLLEDVKDINGLRKKFVGYKRVIRDIKRNKKIPQENKEVYEDMKNFLIGYYNVLCFN